MRKISTLASVYKMIKKATQASLYKLRSIHIRKSAMRILSPTSG